MTTQTNGEDCRESGVWTGMRIRITHHEIRHHCAGHYGVLIHLRERNKDEAIATWNNREGS